LNFHVYDITPRARRLARRVGDDLWDAGADREAPSLRRCYELFTVEPLIGLPPLGVKPART
jgi:hypothetical protein